MTAGWLLSPSAVPIYDGIGAPDDPYRYAGGDPAAAAAQANVPVSGGNVQAVRLQTPETGPQVLLDLPAGVLRAAAPEALDLRLSATPEMPVGQAPGGEWDGNVYRISSSPQAMLAQESASSLILLRAAVMTQPAPVMVYRASSEQLWQNLTTGVSGRDVLSSRFAGLGEYGLVRLPGSQPLGPPGLTRQGLLILVAALATLLTVVILVVRDDEAASDAAEAKERERRRTSSGSASRSSGRGVTARRRRGFGRGSARR